MTILITGAAGQLAHDLIDVLKDEYSLALADRDAFDITDRQAAEHFIRNAKPDVVIHTAAFHNTDECEADPERAFRVNALGTYYVAKGAAGAGAKFFFISTDYVFDGEKEFFTEEDTPRPLNIYGASKLAGEHLSRIACERSMIIRTSWLYGKSVSKKGHNFVELMLDKARRGEDIEVVDDQRGAPTSAHDLAVKIREFIKRDAAPGMYHLVNNGSCSWYEFAEEIFRGSSITPPSLRRISTAERLGPARRPRSSVLKSVMLPRAGIAPMRPWKEALADYIKEVQGI